MTVGLRIVRLRRQNPHNLLPSEFSPFMSSTSAASADDPRSSSAPRSTPAYKVRLLDPNDSSDILTSLWTQCLALTPTAALAKLSGGYLHNPSGVGLFCGVSAGDGQVVGVQGLHVRRFWHAERSVTLGCLADYAVSADHRSAGPAVMLMRSTLAAAADGCEAAYGFPNAKSKALCVRVGLAPQPPMTRLGKMLSVNYLARARSGSWLSTLARPLFDSVLNAIDTTLLFTAARARVECDTAEFSDARIDAIWQGRDTSLLVSERNGRMLAWRYAYDHSRGPWRLLVAQRVNGHPIGYVVYTLSQGLASVSDFFCSRPEADSAALLLAAARRLREMGATAMSLEAKGTPGVMRQLQRALFFKRGHGQAVYMKLFRLDDQQLERLYLTGFDRDQ